MKRSTTKRALLMSGLAMLLSISMLVGTTFAWFTDTVSSGTNQIVAGNLDIELYHSNKEVTDKKVEPTTELFTDVALWEPGAMVYEKFTIANEGDLALKYQFTLNALNATEVEDAEGNKVSFASMLKVAVVDSTFDYNTRAEVLALEASKWAPLESFTLSGNLAKTESDVFGIIIYWEPSDNDNLFNMNNANKGKQVSIDLGVTLFATQDNVEADGFDSTYDENAWADGMQVLTADDLQAAVENAKPGDKIVVMDDITFDGDFVIPSVNATTYSMRSAAGVVINLNGYTLSAANVTTDGVATIVNGTLVLPAEGNVYACDETAISLENVKIVSDGISAYAVRNGSVSLKNVTFVNTATSNPVQNYGGNMTLENVTVAQAGDANTAWYSSAVQVINLLVQDENGKYGITAQADTVINSGTYTGKKAVMISAPGGNVTINGGTFNGSEYAIQADFAPQYYTDGTNYTSVITINGGTFNGAIKATTAAKVVIYGGTFSHDPSAYLAEGYKAVANTNGTFTVVFPQESLDSLIENAGENATIEIPAGEYTFPASDLKAGQTLNCAPGTVFEGTSSLNINGATVIGATFSNPTGTAASQTINGTFKNCVFTGSNGLRWCYSGDTVVFEDCVFDGDVYGVHFDGGAKEVLFKNCTISGFNATAESIEKVTFDGCTFKANGKSNYNGINSWGSTDYINCTFVFDGTAGNEWVHLRGEGKTMTFTNCVVEGNGQLTDYIEKTETGVVIIDGKKFVVAETLSEVMAAAKDGNVIIDAKGANLGDFYYDGTFGNGTVLKNATFTYVYGASVDGVATFENCNFVSDHSYSANFSDGSYTGKVIFNDCYFDGWSSFGDAITGVEMNNCTFDWNNPYSMLRFYQNAVLNNCDFIDIDGIDTNKTGTVVEFNNCTGIEGKIYNNTESGVVKVGTWIVDGVDISDTVTAW